MNNTAIAIDHAKMMIRFINKGGTFVLPVATDVKRKVVISKLKKAGLAHKETTADTISFIKL